MERKDLGHKRTYKKLAIGFFILGFLCAVFYLIGPKVLNLIIEQEVYVGDCNYSELKIAQCNESGIIDCISYHNLCSSVQSVLGLIMFVSFTLAIIFGIIYKIRKKKK